MIGVVSWYPERAIHQRRLRSDHDPVGPWRIARVVIPIALFALIGGTYLLVWSASQSAGEDQAQLFSNDVFDQINNIQYLLIPLLVLAGADFGEWTSFALARLSRASQRLVSPWIFAGIAVVASGLIAWNGLNIAGSDEGGGVAQELILGVLVLGISIGVYFLAKPKAGWKPSVPFVALAIVAIVDSVSGFITEAVAGGANDHLDDYIALVSAAIWVVGALVAVAFLIARRGKASAGMVAGAAFVVLIGVTDLLGNIWVLGNFDNAPLGITSDNALYLGPEGLRAVFAIATIALVIFAIATNRLRRLLVPAGLLLVVTLSLLVLTWIDLLYASAGKVVAAQVSQLGNLAIGGGIVLLLALLWDLAVSGEAITNVDGKWFPRDTRVLMFLGYILLVSSAVLMFSSLFDEKGKLLESAFDPEEWVRQGILFLGIPLIITVALAGLHRWQSSQAAIS